MVNEAKLDIFTRADEVEVVARAIIDAAHTGDAGDGVVAVLPVEKLFVPGPWLRLNNSGRAAEDDCNSRTSMAVDADRAAVGVSIDPAQLAVFLGAVQPCF